MCFSTEASVAVGAALIPAGLYCVRVARRKNRAYLPLALVPFLFAVQQFFEAGVWVGVARGDGNLVGPAALAFLFVALAVWPVSVPIAAAAIEGRVGERRLFAGLAAVGLALGLTFYLPAALNFAEWVEVQVMHHSIRYDFSRVPAADSVWSWIWQALYLAVTCGPLLLSRDRQVQLLGLSVAAAAAYSQAAYQYAFASVWCFFAAALSLQICWVVFKLPSAEEAKGGES